jgi:CheY-like chemotaxis protein
MILEIAGAKVAAAASVHAALDALGTMRPDVIVSDVGMPNEDGFALTRQVRARDADSGGNTPAIALTGYTRPEDRARLLGAGFQTHVRKPVEPDEIVAAVASVVAIGTMIAVRDDVGNVAGRPFNVPWFWKRDNSLLHPSLPPPAARREVRQPESREVAPRPERKRAATACSFSGLIGFSRYASNPAAEAFMYVRHRAAMSERQA